MWVVLLAKYWQYGLIALLVAVLLGMNACHSKALEDKDEAYVILRSFSEAKVAQLNECNSALDRQNAAIAGLREVAEERQDHLDELLAAGPSVIYRDRIVEVPSIVTGTCEEVVVDIAEYVRGVLDEG